MSDYHDAGFRLGVTYRRRHSPIVGEYVGETFIENDTGGQWIHFFQSPDRVTLHELSEDGWSRGERWDPVVGSTVDDLQRH